MSQRYAIINDHGTLVGGGLLTAEKATRVLQHRKDYPGAYCNKVRVFAVTLDDVSADFYLGDLLAEVVPA
jgi:hypothetical protein